MRVERPDERFIGEAARLCAEHSPAQSIPGEALVRPEHDDALAGVEAVLREGLAGGRPLGKEIHPYEMGRARRPCHP